MKVKSLVAVVLVLTAALVLAVVSYRSERQARGRLAAANAALRTQLEALEERTKKLGEAADGSDLVTLANTETFELVSDQNTRRYLIKVGYPRDYETSGKSYPVLYVIDAETNFGGVQYIVQRLIKDRLIPEILVVGIAYNTDYETFYKLRAEDLRPALDEETEAMADSAALGGAQAFSRFIGRQLIPAIERRYRVVVDDRAIYGHSYGGLYGTYALLHEPDLFDRYLILSPSLWWGVGEVGEHILVEQAGTLELVETRGRVYMASGELEPRIDELQARFVARLEPRVAAGLSMKTEIMENETHRTIFGPAFMNGMRYIYSE